jgi:hypothetical protein
MKHYAFSYRTLAVLFVSVMLIHEIKLVSATDGEPIMDLGTFSWLKYQQKQFFTEIEEVLIKDGIVQRPDVVVNVLQPVIFENLGDTNHRLVFVPGIENKMDYPYTSPVIKPGERWGLEIHSFGVFEYQCSLHPEVRGKFTVKILH